MNAALGGLEIANWDAAEALFRETLEGARRLGLENLAAATQNNLGSALACAGRTAEARAELVAAIEGLERQQDRRMLGGARIAAPPLRPQSFARRRARRVRRACSSAHGRSPRLRQAYLHDRADHALFFE